MARKWEWCENFNCLFLSKRDLRNQLALSRAFQEISHSQRLTQSASSYAALN